jgi:hypothetical protein
MRGSFNTVEFLLITAVVIALTAFALPWITGTINESLDIGELASIQNQFKSCSNKILETARTGTTNKCVFSISRGTIDAKTEGLEYLLLSSAPICTPHPLEIIDEQSHIYQHCIDAGLTRVYKMIWMFPSQIKVEAETLSGTHIKGGTPVGNIDFGSGPIEFRTLTLMVEFDYAQNMTGTNIELTRKSMSVDKVVIGVKIY